MLDTLSKHFNPFIFVSFCASPKSSGLIPEKATRLILQNYLFCKNEITNKRISLQPMYGSVASAVDLALVLLPGLSLKYFLLLGLVINTIISPNRTFAF